MRKEKYFFHIEAGNNNSSGWNGKKIEDSINIHVKAYNEKEALETAKRLLPRKYYSIYRVDKETL